MSLAAVYVSLFLLASAVLPGGPTVGATTAAAVCGLLLHPLGVRLNRGVDRMFYGDRADPARVLEATATGLREGLDLTEAPERVCTVVVESLRLGSAAILLGDGSNGAPLAAVGTPNGPVTSLPMKHRGEVVGTLRVTARPGRRACPPATPSCWPSSATRSPRPSPRCGSPTGSNRAGPRS